MRQPLGKDILSKRELQDYQSVYIDYYQDELQVLQQTS